MGIGDRMRRLGVCGLVLFVASLLPAASAHAQRRYINDEFGLSVVFHGPVAGRVCEGLSGGHPHGFYAWYGSSRGCSRDDDLPQSAAAIGIYASYNSLGAQKAGGALDGRCNFSLPTHIVKEIKALSFRGRPSFACASKQRDGTIALSVVTLAGPWDDETVPGHRIRSIEYEASLVVTRPQDIARRMALFKAFLHDARIRAPR